MIVDIAVNISDDAFKNKDELINKCKQNKVIPIFIGTDYKSSIDSLNLAEKYNTYSYLGIHPTSKDNFDLLIPYLSHPKILAIGECGLDFDRLMFTTKQDQVLNFTKHLQLNAPKYFFHCRNAYREFLEMLENQKGVVHSFTGNLDDANELIRKSLYIGINGCSFKTQQLVDTIKEIPIDSILVETDAPFCKIRKSSPVYNFIEFLENEKKYQKINEPVTVIQIVQVLAQLKEIEYEEFKKILNANVVKCFGEKSQNLKKFLDEDKFIN